MPLRSLVAAGSDLCGLATRHGGGFFWLSSLKQYLAFHTILSILLTLVTPAPTNSRGVSFFPRESAGLGSPVQIRIIARERVKGRGLASTLPYVIVPNHKETNSANICIVKHLFWLSHHHFYWYHSAISCFRVWVSFIIKHWSKDWSEWRSESLEYQSGRLSTPLI